MTAIYRLSETTVNRIAAGEVIERPAAVVKELVENAIDADATRIEITMVDGGAQLIRVIDDGCGMSCHDLPMAVLRHATSKLTNDTDLLNIKHLGFRGEALPSIGAVSRLTISSRACGEAEAWALSVEGGTVFDVTPASQPQGTRIEVKDLFYATPARLNFMRSGRAEQMAATDVIKRLAMAYPEVNFTLHTATTLSNPTKISLKAPAADRLPGEQALLQRLGQVMGRDFPDNALRIDAERDGTRLHGFIGLPTLNKRTAQSQFLFVNGRPVQDKLFRGAIRGGYQDVLAHDRHSVLALYLEVPPHMVDVNVHPAKSEVRFREPGLVRGMIVSSLKLALAEAGHRTSSTLSIQALGKVRVETPKHTQAPLKFAAPRAHHYGPAMSARPVAAVPAGMSEAATTFQAPITPQLYTEASGYGGRVDETPTTITANGALPPLGLARAQLHQTYIVAQTADGIVIVDQHAAHERLTLERLKAQMLARSVERQLLLLPEVLELDPDDAKRICERAAELESLGLVVEPFGEGAVMVRETPALLGNVNIQNLLRDMVEDFTTWESSTALIQKIDHVIATMACHGSIRAGRVMTPEEMNALLRDMENTPLSGQCAHGRPTYIELKLNDVERLFGRKN